MKSMITSSTLISIMPTLIPDFIGVSMVGKGFPAEAGEGGPGVGVRVDPDAEPRDAVAAQDPDDAEDDDDDDLDGGVVEQEAEVNHHDRGDERPQDRDKFPLRDEGGLAGFVDQIRNFKHRLVNGKG